jgi:hypothetical protein
MGTNRETLIGDIVVAAREVVEYAEESKPTTELPLRACGEYFERLQDALQAWDAYHRAVRG